MQFLIHPPPHPRDIARFAEQLEYEDPGALLEHAADAGLRLATHLSRRERFALASTGGLMIAVEAIERLPSECCGGCGG